MIIDAQIHLWAADRPDRPWPRSGGSSGDRGRTATPQRSDPMTAAEAIPAMDAAGVDKAIIVPPSWEGDRNDIALAAVREYPGRFAVMGRIGPNPANAGMLKGWRAQAGMLGLRVILAKGTLACDEGLDHWLWRAAAEHDLPLMIAPVGNMPLLAQIAHAFPNLRLTIDHMGARIHHYGAEAFSDIDAVLALAARPNVAVKGTALPCYSAGQRPWADVMPYWRRLFEAYGPQRLFWGSDLSRLPCPYGDLVATFRDDLDWLDGEARAEVMGRAVARWHGWAV